VDPSNVARLKPCPSWRVVLRFRGIGLKPRPFKAKVL
jgi:hypothetical protein